MPYQYLRIISEELISNLGVHFLYGGVAWSTPGLNTIGPLSHAQHTAQLLELAYLALSRTGLEQEGLGFRLSYYLTQRIKEHLK